MTPNITIKAILAFHDTDHAIPEVVIKEIGKRHRQLISAGVASDAGPAQITAIAWNEADALAETNPMLALGLSVLDELTAAERAYGRVEATNITVMDIPLSDRATAALAFKLLNIETVLDWAESEMPEREEHGGLTVIVRQPIPNPPEDTVLHEELFLTTWNYIGPYGVLLNYRELEGAE